MFMEPYKIKVVEPIAFTTRAERKAALESAGYNLFKLRSSDVTIDLFTDSGTSAMSQAQQAAMMLGDEAYAGAGSYYRFESVVRDIMGYRHVLPCHQGRAAERILFSCLLTPGQITISNGHFDTTRANIELRSCEARDLPAPSSADLSAHAPFKGDLDVDALAATLDGPEGGMIGAVILTITNNAGGGQPASMQNAEAVSRLCRSHGVPFLLDAARFAENAWLVHRREQGWGDTTPKDIARRMFELADGAWSSLKKDGLGNIGGVLAINDDDLAARCRDLLIATEGFPTYGGLAGRDLEALAQGLSEVTEPAYLASRESFAMLFAEIVREAGISTVQPPGLHAIYLDAGALLSHIPAHEFPGQALCCELYLEGGVRSFEIGSLLLGQPKAGEAEVTAGHELVRLCLPRRVYTKSHLEYVGEVMARVAARAERLVGLEIIEAPLMLRHFSARLAPLSP